MCSLELTEWKSKEARARAMDAQVVKILSKYPWSCGASELQNGLKRIRNLGDAAEDSLIRILNGTQAEPLPNEEIRASAAAYIGKRKMEKAIPSLMAILGEFKWPDTRNALAPYFGQSLIALAEMPKAAPLVHRYAADENKGLSVRIEALGILAQFAQHYVKPPNKFDKQITKTEFKSIIRLFEDMIEEGNHPFLRIHCINHCFDFRDHLKNKDKLVELLKDKTPIIAQKALQNFVAKEFGYEKKEFMDCLVSIIREKNLHRLHELPPQEFFLPDWVTLTEKGNVEFETLVKKAIATIRLETLESVVKCGFDASRDMVFMDEICRSIKLITDEAESNEVEIPPAISDALSKKLTEFVNAIYAERYVGRLGQEEADEMLGQINGLLSNEPGSIQAGKRPSDVQSTIRTISLQGLNGNSLARVGVPHA